MTGENKAAVLGEFRSIPGVGESIAEDLWQLGLRSLADIRDEDPEVLYSRHCDQKGRSVDRCVLYVFRCAHYYASGTDHDPELLKWWNWKDKE